MATTVPEWLAKRDGSLTPGVNKHMLFVLIGGAPQCKVEARPAAGTFICEVQQSINGKRLDDATAYPTADAALAGGLEQLKNKLGW
ncbi:MAG TPA: hypothetical protein VMZ71_17740 [Gemmataceae bacterium]|nr:hypothetical protein [Gemmataceae bacterium]